MSANRRPALGVRCAWCGIVVREPVDLLPSERLSWSHGICDCCLRAIHADLDRIEQEIRRERRLVAVVDDDAVHRNALARFLRVDGYEVVVYKSAEAYLNKPPLSAACVLLDVMLPGMSGLHLLHRLHQSAPTLPVVVMTTNGDAMTQSHAERIGCAGFLAKPCGSDMLAAVLASVLRNA